MTDTTSTLFGTGEFFQLRAAFLKTIMPHVDQALLKQVQSATWLMLDEPR